jgi:hypothetical protein
MRSGPLKAISSFSQKRLFRLGDGTAIAILKALEPSSLTDRHFVLTVLSIIQGGFAHPELISNDSDKKPSVTMLLLSYLKLSFADDLEIQKLLDETRNFIDRQTAPSGDIPTK